jgi:hypothetical protein
LVEQVVQPPRLRDGHHSGFAWWCDQQDPVVLDENGHRPISSERVVAVDPTLGFSHLHSDRGAARQSAALVDDPAA